MMSRMFKKRQTVLNEDRLQDKIYSLVEFYMPMNLNPASYNKKVIAIKKMDYILKHTTPKHLQDADFGELLICALMMIYFFGMRLKEVRLKHKVWYCNEKRDFDRAETTFQKTISFLAPDRIDIVIKLTLNFFTEISLWRYENFAGEILEVVLYYSRGTITLFNSMLTDIHYALFSDVPMTRHRMRVLYELLKSNNWIIDNQKLLPFITRLLDFFAKSENQSSVYKHLRMGFEVCLRRIFERAGNMSRLRIITTMLNWFSLTEMSEEYVLEFSSLLDRAAELYTVGSYTDSISDGLVIHILRNLVGSTNSLYSLLGCRLLLRFLDRQNNVKYLVTPTIFYEFTQIKLTVGSYDSGDKSFIRNYRENIYTYLLKACKNHCSNGVNLKAIFLVICCLVLEVPCGLTAATAAYIVMSIQDYALNGENITATCRYWMHAIVVSVMSLICWVHKSPVLYSYVSHIIYRRAKEAPQLNPPLMQTYIIGRQHVTWNKPTLFFEDWELRYGLWKHFVDQKLRKIEQEIQQTKMPRLKNSIQF